MGWRRLRHPSPFRLPGLSMTLVGFSRGERFSIIVDQPTVTKEMEQPFGLEDSRELVSVLRQIRSGLGARFPTVHNQNDQHADYSPKPIQAIGHTHQNSWEQPRTDEVPSSESCSPSTHHFEAPTTRGPSGNG